MYPGFKIVFYNLEKGYVLMSCIGDETEQGFYVNIKAALLELDRVRELNGYEPRLQSLRLNRRN